jgi:general secretion pathway protein K
MPSLREEKGMVLLLVLVVVALLTSLLTEFAFSTLVDLRLTETFRDSTRAYYLAKGGVRVGRIILQEDTNTWDARSELWGQGVSSYPVGDGVVSVHIEDLEGRLNINHLVDKSGFNPNTVFRGRFIKLFAELDLAEPDNLTAALVDWIDSDSKEDAPGGGIRGAEDDYYLRLEKPYHCKNAPLDSLDELAMIRGFTPEVRRALEPHVTIHGDKSLNINTASPQTLFAWYAWDDPLLDTSIAEAIVTARENEPIRDTTDLKAVIDVNDFAVLNQQSDIAVKSGTYRIESLGEVNDGTRMVEAIVKKTGNKLLFTKVN